ncbi:hypothetical protein QWZ03_01765 [Chitinimonas viridis]|uniref:Uncharacterized protein n=1 Tax=Chitinimonas viridis TaxID=664880 RepID=A0ABT8AZS3_9NEIS|nr:hypothetical protein [Chitinimonas viridis]MDN3575497.1 hypothetical protein [Chitinimonas viridis]
MTKPNAPSTTRLATHTSIRGANAGYTRLCLVSVAAADAAKALITRAARHSGFQDNYRRCSAIPRGALLQRYLVARGRRTQRYYQAIETYLGTYRQDFTQPLCAADLISRRRVALQPFTSKQQAK